MHQMPAGIRFVSGKYELASLVYLREKREKKRKENKRTLPACSQKLGQDERMYLSETN